METVETLTPQIAYGVFNKHNGVLFCFESDKETAYSYSPNNFIIKEIELLPGQYYFGDYETGQVYFEEDKPLVREDEVQQKYHLDIVQTYPIIEQLNIIVEVLNNNKDIVKTDSFNEMAKFLKSKKLRYEQSLKATKENKHCFNFISIKELQELNKKRVEGIV